MSDLAELVRIWRSAADDAVALLRDLGADDWDRPTDLPGWTVRSVASHLAHLESELAGNPQRQVVVPDLPHVIGPMGQYTEAGVIARADWEPARIIDELESSVAQRHQWLTSNLPEDPAATADGFAAVVGWSWQTLLSNRPLDMWMHEQDIRRAVARPGNLDTDPARHVVGVFLRALPMVVGKRVSPPAGKVIRVSVTGPVEVAATVKVGEDGRAVAAPEADATTDVRLTTEQFILLAGGRRGPEQVGALDIAGDSAWGEALVANLAVTP